MCLRYNTMGSEIKILMIKVSNNSIIYLNSYVSSFILKRSYYFSQYVGFGRSYNSFSKRMYLKFKSYFFMYSEVRILYIDLIFIDPLGRFKSFFHFSNLVYKN